MKYFLVTIVLIAFGIALPSFLVQKAETPQQKIKAYYSAQYKKLSQQLVELKKAVETDADEIIIQQHFLQSRLTYKHIEFLVEYYFELDVNKINGPPVDFIEEEDPTAYQEPQGFQMIESFIFPRYDNSNKLPLLNYVNKLGQLTTGLSNNAINFQPDTYLVDAAMEQLYRIMALGITGFDSPLALDALPEARASLESIEVVVQAYKDDIDRIDKNNSRRLMKLLKSAERYLDKHSDFHRFNRMEFITRYMNPVSQLLGEAGSKLGYVNNPARKTVIKKNSHLFALNSLQNRYLNDDVLTLEKIALGKKLFFEPLLSANGKRSCAGCHQPGYGFTDGLPKAMDLDEHSKLPRNTPTLWNAALQRNLFADSRQVSLDHLITEVLSNEKEMNSGIDAAAQKINTQPVYIDLYYKAYPNSGDKITGKKLVNAIAMYLHTLTSYSSRFDRYVRGDKTAMNANEVNGFNLFMGKARCGTCHFAPLFNGSKPPAYFYQESEVIGVPASTDTVHPVLDADEGRFVFTRKAFHKHAFKTPTLRNIALTAPYMHNGVYNTLEEVIDFYNKGGAEGLGIAPDNQTLLPDSLNLSQPEKEDLVLFLHTLTDTSAAKISVAYPGK